MAETQLEHFNAIKTSMAVLAVLTEGDRARAKHGDSPLATFDQFFTILLEEVGEVAKAKNEHASEEEIRKEITQVASVALRYLAGDLAASGRP